MVNALIFLFEDNVGFGETESRMTKDAVGERETLFLRRMALTCGIFDADFTARAGIFLNGSTRVDFIVDCSV